MLLLSLQDNEHANGCGVTREMVRWIKMETGGSSSVHGDLARELEGGRFETSMDQF